MRVGPKSGAEPPKCAFEIIIKKYMIFRSESDAKVGPEKVSFLMILGTPGRYGAKWVPEGRPRVHIGRQGCQKTQNMRPRGVEK